MAHQPYQALQQLLDKVDSIISPATVHGLWCGRLSAKDNMESAEWWNYTWQVINTEMDVPENMKAAVKAVAGYAANHMQQENFGFELWLPEDDQDIRIRMDALADWCQGYIEGLTSVLGGELVSVSDDAKELLQDLLDIGELDCEVDGSEDDEKQLMELTEFVKVAALNLWHEFRGNNNTEAGKAEISQPEGNTPSPTIH